MVIESWKKKADLHFVCCLPFTVGHDRIVLEGLQFTGSKVCYQFCSHCSDCSDPFPSVQGVWTMPQTQEVIPVFWQPCAVSAGACHSFTSIVTLLSCLKASWAWWSHPTPAYRCLIPKSVVISVSFKIMPFRISILKNVNISVGKMLSQCNNLLSFCCTWIANSNAFKCGNTLDLAMVFFSLEVQLNYFYYKCNAFGVKRW